VKNLVAIIVGGTGQFGIITSEFLLKKNYKVIITTRSINKKKKLFKKHSNLKLYKLDIYNKIKINKLLYKYKPSLVFYFAGQSSPAKSFLYKKETYKSNVLGCKNFLDVILKNNYNCKFVNASSCEMYGKINNKIKVSSIKKPINPYGLSKLKSFEITKKYRETHNIKTYNAIIFNTESFFREKSYFIPKICLAAIYAKKYNLKTEFGNLKISREWNWCPEQVKYLLEFIKKKPQDFILSNGKNYSALQMLRFAFKYFNLNYKNYILINKKKFFRKKDMLQKKSDWKSCLIKNKINRKVLIYGNQLTTKLIEHYLKKNY
jgi:GDPmannose 4,6-dehydratase